MKVLLCLLSDQHVPNLLSVHHFEPDRLVLIETEQMKKRKVADHFLSALKLGELDYTDRHHIESLSVEDDLGEVRKSLQHAFGKFPDAEWIANLTGGTKPMSIATHEFFKALGGKLIYTNVARPARIIDTESGVAEECDHKLGIKEFLAGYGFESRKADAKLDESEKRAREWACSARLLAINAAEQEILPDDDERKRARDKGIELPADRFHFPCEELREIWLNGATKRTLTKYEAEFLTGGWLEVFVWDVLTRHQDYLGIWNVRLGLEVGRIGDQSGNEFDVAFMHNHGLSMVECKSGAQKHDAKGDVIYKMEAVKRQFGAIRVGSFLATTASNILDANKKPKDPLKTRAGIYQCRILTCDHIRELGKDFENVETVQRLLFGQLE